MIVPGFKAGDRICILRHEWSDNPTHNAVLTEPILGKPTVLNFLKTLERGLNRNIGSADRKTSRGRKVKYWFDYTRMFNLIGKRMRLKVPTRNEIVYVKISYYFDKELRMKLVQKYENGKLKPHELYGDSIFFEGMTKKGNIWFFNTGS